MRNAEVLEHLIGELWETYGSGAPGVVLIGHSIGGAVTAAIAARHPAWPLLGIAVSGCLVRVPSESGEAWAALPDLEFVELPGQIKDFVMYGPDWTHSAKMPDAGHAADAPVPKAELLDITGGWVERMPESPPRSGCRCTAGKVSSTTSGSATTLKSPSSRRRSRMHPGSMRG